MKRSERFKMRAWRCALWAMAVFSATCAGCVWLAVPGGALRASGGVLAALLLGAAGLAAVWCLLAEGWRLARMAMEEDHWDRVRAIRPRL